MAEQFVDPIKARRSLRELLLQAFTPKASAFFLEQAKIQSQTAIDKLDEAQLTNLLRVATNNRFNVTGAGDFTNSQVSVGGVPVSEVDPHSCQSLLIPGLYLVGRLTIDWALEALICIMRLEVDFWRASTLPVR